MRTDDVLADPATPNNNAALLHKVVFFYNKTKSKSFFALNESIVGIKIYENLIFPEGFHSSGLHSFQSKWSGLTK